MEKSYPGKEGHSPIRVNLANVYMTKKKTPLLEPTADNSARACSDCLALTELTRLGESKYLYGEKLARLGG